MNKQNILNNPWMDFASYGIKDASRFKGREEEIKKFLRIIDSGTMSVLYANTGIGKTSFLNAGISPVYQQMGYFPIHIVFPDEFFSRSDTEEWLLQRINDAFTKHNGSNTEDGRRVWESTIENDIKECQNSLWWHLHTKVMKDLNTGNTYLPLLIFDQFEEIFTKSKKFANKEILKSFFRLIGHLASSSLPDEIEKELEAQDKKGNYIEIDSKHHYKVVFSLRKEYLSDFDYWTNDVNSISELRQNRMFLLPLKREQAEKVITQQPFENEDTECYKTLNNVTNKILDLIDSKKKDEIEPFILSALCSKLYNKAVSENKEQLEPSDVDANMSNIILEIYEEKVQTVFHNIAHLKKFEATLVDGDGHRNRPKIKDLDDIQFKEVYQKQLEDAHLIRTDTYDDDIYVELIHDLLAQAINNKRKKEEQDRLIAELKKTKKKQRFWRTFSAIVGLFASFIGLTWYYYKSNQQHEVFNNYHTINVDIIVDTAFADKTQWEADVIIKTLDSDSVLFLCHINEDNKDQISFQLPEHIYQHDSIRVIVEPTDSLRLCMNRTISLMPKDSIKQLFIEYNRDARFPVKGKVVYKRNGENVIPINHAYVTLNGEVVQTDDNGNFRFMFNDYNMTKQGCLSVFKQDFKYMQYELEFLRQQSGDMIEVELPLCENIPMDSLFEKRRKAIDNLHRKTTRYPNRNAETTEVERKWMLDIAVLDTIKRNLRYHSCHYPTDLFSEINFVSCDNGNNSNMRPIYGWYKKDIRSTPFLFYGTMYLMSCKDNPKKDIEYWRIRITSFEKKTFHTEEHSFIIENPRSNNSEIVEIEY